MRPGLDFLLDVMGGGDYGDTDTIIQVLEKYLPDYDQSKGDNASALASACPKAIRDRNADSAIC